jgi:hypothetical protein
MITLIRTANMHDGKGHEAFAWAIKLGHYLNEKFSEGSVQVVRNIGGPVWQVHWVVSFESLATLEEVMKRVEADSGYLELLGEARDQELFISSGTVDSLYETIS